MITHIPQVLNNTLFFHICLSFVSSIPLLSHMLFPDHQYASYQFTDPQLQIYTFFVLLCDTGIVSYEYLSFYIRLCQ